MIRSRRVPRLVWIAAFSVQGVAGGCALFVSFDDVALDPGAGGAGTGGAGGAGGGAGGGSVGVDDCTMFVAPDGDDDADGLTPATALRSLGEGIVEAGKSDSPAVVCVCGVGAEQTYVVDALVMDRQMSLIGAYDCATWTRSPEVEQVVTDQRTFVVRKDRESAAPTLLVLGTSIDDSSRIDGFHFRPPLASEAGTTTSTVAIVGASPTLSHTVAQGHALDGASVGLAVVEGGAPLIVASWLGGGAGGVGEGFFAPSSIALLVQNASPAVFVSLLDGQGASSADTGSVGLLVAGSDTQIYVEGAAIFGGVTAATLGTGSAGVVVGALAAAHITQSRIDGGEGRTEDAVAPHSEAMRVGELAGALLIRNALFGGEPELGAEGWVVAAHVRGEAGLYSNMIHGGIAAATRGVHIENGGAPTKLVHNTIFAGSLVGASTSDPAGVAIDVRAAQTFLMHNLLFGSAPAQSRSVGIRFAEPAHFEELAGNAFVGFEEVTSAHATLTASETAILGAEGTNVRVAPSCAAEGGSPRCYEVAACSNGPSCDQLTFTAPHGKDDIVGRDLELSGWRLYQPLCALAESSVLETDGRFPDFFGTVHDDPVSIGAHEHPRGACE